MSRSRVAVGHIPGAGRARGRRRPAAASRGASTSAHAGRRPTPPATGLTNAKQAAGRIAGTLQGARIVRGHRRRAATASPAASLRDGCGASAGANLDIAIHANEGLDHVRVVHLALALREEWRSPPASVNLAAVRADPRSAPFEAVDHRQNAARPMGNVERLDAARIAGCRPSSRDAPATIGTTGYGKSTSDRIVGADVDMLLHLVEF